MSGDRASGCARRAAVDLLVCRIVAQRLAERTRGCKRPLDRICALQPAAARKPFATPQKSSHACFVVKRFELPL